MTSTANNKKIINVLCLHGYLQNGEIMKSKMLKKWFNSKHNVQYLDGCYDCGVTDNTKKGWWYLDRDHLFDREYDFGTEFLEYIKAKVTVSPDFIVAFSQGCLVATILHNLNIFPSLRGLILISGSPVVDPKYLPVDKLKIPTLHWQLGSYL